MAALGEPEEPIILRGVFKSVSPTRQDKRKQGESK